MAESLKNKNILLGISGGIAAFKICELLRLLVKAGAKVRVVMTESASKFVAPLTFSALGAESVSTNMWDPNRDSLQHVNWADWADIIVIAPATANIIAKMASGIADDALSTQLLAFDGAKLIAPAMNVKMWQNYATQRNINELKKHNIQFIGPTKGHLANMAIAEGRMVEPDEIFKRLKSMIRGRDDLAGYKILVTAGPTVEPLDPVRFISNRSSGKMGYAIAEALKDRGAEVILVSGPVSIKAPLDVEVMPVETTEQMKTAVDRYYNTVDSVFMTAAVADYKPKVYSKQKIKKSKQNLSLLLVKNPDILSALASKRNRKILVGFALETENLKAAAKRKMLDKKLDIIVANNPTQKGVEFGSDFNKAVIFIRGKKPVDLQVMPKIELAHVIIDELVKLFKDRKK
ncbi:MAG: bifunctional phosphopantothenoylcysteine decarboxylase/phosphopantothenate--cysteine ligase CoaBC [candidate division Zixibacteria bacterium]|nr:bifunctional phosphopantothenoylcysteine decarboxylase/phosphopantothenate--cysteine ligase CoaBC [candidate division Zixibacteria bacterium]